MVICLRWVVVLSVLGVIVAMCVGVCEWCISSQVCIVAVLSVCNSDEPNNIMCCVCVVTSD